MLLIPVEDVFISGKNTDNASAEDVAKTCVSQAETARTETRQTKRMRAMLPPFRPGSPKRIQSKEHEKRKKLLQVKTISWPAGEIGLPI